MARTKADSHNKAARKAPRKVTVFTGGQASNVKAGSTSKGTGNSYCPRPKSDVNSFFPKPGEPLMLKNFRVKKPEATAEAGAEMVESSCSVDEKDSENAGPVDEVDSEKAGPSNSPDDVGSEIAGPSKCAGAVDREKARPIIIASFKTVNLLPDENCHLIDDETFVMIYNDDLFEEVFY